MRTYLSLSFDQQDFMILNRVRPSIPVAFPELHDKDQPKPAGRHLSGVCARRGERFPAEWIHEAWAEAITLEAVLSEQADRAYWDRELTHPHAPADSIEHQPDEPGGRSAVGLIAPGTDIAAMLTEARAAMLHDLRDALPLLAAAKQQVGAIPTDDETDD